MPRKRTTRAKAASKVKLPDVEIASEISENDLQQQLQMYLADFHTRAKTILKDIEKAKQKMIIAIHRSTEAQIANIPNKLKHMTMRELAAAGGTIDAALEYAKEQQAQSVQSSTARLEAFRSTAPLITTIPEDPNQAECIPSKKEVHTVKSKRAAKSKFMKTPAITPKFNPYLRSTPENIRDERPGEMLMSITGTPVRRVLKDDRKTLEDNLATVGFHFTPETMNRLIDTVASSVRSFRK